MSWTLEEAKKRLQNWLEAEEALSTGQSYTIAGRSLTRVHLSEVMKQIDFWRKEVDNLTRESQGLKPRGGFTG
ncbi:DUF6148 family protein [Paenibacillus larvae]|nr:DUF6148 family protein [Paenibacillus larvae]MDT2292347.1 DUF6148 family protein [Paenibacillus larvae]